MLASPSLTNARSAFLAVAFSFGCSGAAATEDVYGLETWEEEHDIALQAEPPEQLTFLTYNVFMRPNPIGAYDYPDCRGKEIGRRLDAWGADVVALQETWNAAPVAGTLQAIGNLPVRVTGRPAAQGRPSGGLTLLSRWPIEAVNTEVFDECSGEDCFVAKGILHAVIRVAEKSRVHVVATHLNAGRNAAGASARASQMEQLRRFIDGLDREVGPVVILGDFNTDSLLDNGEYEGLLQTLRVEDDAESRLSTVNCDTSIFCEEPVPAERLDYVLTEIGETRLLRGATTHHALPRPEGVCDEHALWLSDHQLVETRFTTDW